MFWIIIDALVCSFLFWTVEYVTRSLAYILCYSRFFFLTEIFPTRVLSERPSIPHTCLQILDSLTECKILCLKFISSATFKMFDIVFSISGVAFEKFRINLMLVLLWVFCSFSVYFYNFLSLMFKINMSSCLTVQNPSDLRFFSFNSGKFLSCYFFIIKEFNSSFWISYFMNVDSFT